jgi:hypothetical protein
MSESISNVGDEQTKLQIILRSDVDMSAGSGEVPSSVEIWYWAPTITEEPINSNKSGAWTAAVVAGRETEGAVAYNLADDEPMARGTWWFRIHAVYADARVMNTRLVSIIVGA